jgi:hypothetical protein
MLENAGDRASERQANIAQPKRVSAGHPGVQPLDPNAKRDGVHAELGGTHFVGFFSACSMSLTRW